MESITATFYKNKLYWQNPIKNNQNKMIEY